MKIAFCTCVQIGLSCIESVISNGGQFDLFITLHDHKSKSKSGRVYLDEIADNTKTPLLKINHINDQEVIDKLEEHEIDWLFIIGWSQIASKSIIETPNIGAIGAHPTLLPRGRGRAAIPWAIIKKEEKTGVTFFKMDEGVDTGDILGQIEIPLNVESNATDLYNSVNVAHVDLINKLWSAFVENTLEPIEQDDKKATYWEGRKPEDGLISLNMTMEEVDCLVRGTTRPYPGAFLIRNSKKIVIWKGYMSEEPKDITNDNIEIRLSDGYYYGVDIDSEESEII